MFAQLIITYSIYVTTPKVHMSVGNETKSKFTTSGDKNSGVPKETLSFSLGLYLEMEEQSSHNFNIWIVTGSTQSEINSGH